MGQPKNYAKFDTSAFVKIEENTPYFLTYIFSLSTLVIDILQVDLSIRLFFLDEVSAS